MTPMFFNRIYRFIASVYCALALMSCLIASISIATWIESATESHLQAAQWIYRAPFFKVLLCLLFLNILCSAARRWPFKLKHVPFLLAHLGLLMVLGGVLYKQQFGLQGNLLLVEGSGSHTLTIPEQIALTLEKRAPEKGNHPLSTQVPIIPGHTIVLPKSLNSELEIALLNFWPHSIYRIISWIKEDYLWIFGYLPHQANQESPLLISQGPPGLPSWQAYALRSNAIAEAVRNQLIEHANLRAIAAHNGHVVYEGSLSNALTQGIMNEGQRTTVALELEYSLHNGWSAAQVCASNFEETIHIPLMGQQALINRSTHAWKAPALEFSLEMPPTLLFIEDLTHSIHLIGISQHGELWSTSFPAEQPSSLMIYDQGFNGYGIEAEIPLLNHNGDRHSRLEALKLARMRFLQDSLNPSTTLLPPLEILRQATQIAGTDFIAVLIELVQHWKNQRSWLLNDQVAFSPELRKTLATVDWEEQPLELIQTCDWMIKVLQDLDLDNSSVSTYTQLQDKQWPLLKQMETRIDARHDDAECRKALMQQLLEVSHHLAQVGGPQASAIERLSLLLRLYDFDWKVLLEMGEQDSIQDLLLNFEALPPAFLKLETAVSTQFEPFYPLEKLEDNRPLVQLLIKQGDRREIVTLGLDRGQGVLKQPILKGEYRVRLEPLQVEIPYHVRLLDAQQVMHPDLRQTSSYESRVLFTDRRSGKSQEALLSMNHVFETDEGYRFYLSGLAPAEEIAPRQVNLVVNHDPVRWRLTYPGAFFIVLGSVLLLLKCFKSAGSRGN